MHRSRSVVLLAHAKINLGLDLIRKRPDGYHEIATVMQQIALADTVRLFTPSRALGPAAPTGGVRLRVRGPQRGRIGPVADNLCVRAARGYFEAAGFQAPLRIELTKRIPAGAGLGGGSSDAAAVLRGLALLFPCRLSRREILRVAAALGSDVAFFLCGPAALCRGRGEIVRPFRPAKPLHCVLVLPEIHVSTSRVYGSAGVRGRRIKTRLTSTAAARALRSGELKGLSRRLRNDLEGPALRVAPRLARVRRAMERLPFSAVSMSGSGSAFFGLARSFARARALAARLRREAPWIGEVLTVRSIQGTIDRRARVRR